MQGITNFTPQQAARCPYLRMTGGATQEQAPAQNRAPAANDSVSISPFEPADAGPLTKTCVRSGAQATMAALPGFAKAGCPHAG